jgi:hypothetical protein
MKRQHALEGSLYRERNIVCCQGRKCVWGGGGGVGGGGGGGGFGSPPPQRNDPVGLKLSAVGLKIMCLFTRGALRSKLNI